MEVFHALNVGEGLECAVVVLNQAAGDASDRSGDGYAGIHQSQGGTADGALGSGAVGGQHLGDHTDGVREVRFGG